MKDSRRCPVRVPGKRKFVVSAGLADKDRVMDVNKTMKAKVDAGEESETFTARSWLECRLFM